MPIQGGRVGPEKGKEELEDKVQLSRGKGCLEGGNRLTWRKNALAQGESVAPEGTGGGSGNRERNWDD